jgi:hypothetical protein
MGSEAVKGPCGTALEKRSGANPYSTHDFVCRQDSPIVKNTIKAVIGPICSGFGATAKTDVICTEISLRARCIDTAIVFFDGFPDTASAHSTGIIFSGICFA